MVDVIFKTKISKVKDNFLAMNIKAGIIYNENFEPIDKIMFVEEDGKAKDVFSDKEYNLEATSEDLFVDSIVDLSAPILHFLKKHFLTLADLYLVYRMFINDNKFIKRHLDYFDMKMVPVGYDGKFDIIEIKGIRNKENQALYHKLNNIINYKKSSKLEDINTYARK